MDNLQGRWNIVVGTSQRAGTRPSGKMYIKTLISILKIRRLIFLIIINISSLLTI